MIERKKLTDEMKKEGNYRSKNRRKDIGIQIKKI